MGQWKNTGRVSRSKRIRAKSDSRQDDVRSADQSSRRSLLKGAVAGATAVGLGAWSSAPALAHDTQIAAGAGPLSSSVSLILDVARTFEQLAVVFYSNVLANADKLGIIGDALAGLKAVLVEEQLHQQYFMSSGGHSMIDSYSFPHGPQTFTDMKTFIATQQIMEGIFDSAFLAAVFEFAVLGHPDLAQVAGQIATIEAEHRALGRSIGGSNYGDNWAFTPVTIRSVRDVPALLQKMGFWTPTEGNTYSYQAISTAISDVLHRVPYSMSLLDVPGRG